SETYGLNKEAAVYEVPLFKSMTVKGSAATIDFDNAEAGLLIKGSLAKEIYIAGSDKVFYPASVKIKGNTIIVLSKQVKTPIAVRYQFSNAGIGNLFSKTGLPVAPFRTDTWELSTDKIK